MAKKKTDPGTIAVVEPTSTFLTLKRVRHEGDRYLPGEEIELTEAQALHLLAAEAVIRFVRPVELAPVVETV